jgi:hypothetical protein
MTTHGSQLPLCFELYQSGLSIGSGLEVEDKAWKIRLERLELINKSCMKDPVPTTSNK